MGPPKAFYNSRGLCNVCHKTLRHRQGPPWDTAWDYRSWTGRPTGEVGIISEGGCSRRCGPVARAACGCGGPGGTGLPSKDWRERLGPRYEEAVLEGDLVDALDAWDNLPPEIGTQAPKMLAKPLQWLRDVVGTYRGPDPLTEAARVANAAIYRWWRSSPGVPGPGLAVVVAGEQLKLVKVAAADYATELWETRVSLDDLVWTSDDDLDTPPPLDLVVTVTPPPVMEAPSMFEQVKRRVAVPLSDAAISEGLERPQVWVEGREWELGWSVGPEWLNIAGSLGVDTISVTWSHAAGISETSTSLTIAPWREFFAAVAERRREAWVDVGSHNSVGAWRSATPPG